ncbi:glutamyl aminopeptidase-like [Formica exsecta]|uniref:glutamyl aminopeptidase-like n=1 Tax=Formica exsecta TaxID=72781 RepID=UPI00114386DD|nr:glutamyl aminopeptidase-like [Formica exsecta]
MIFLIILLSSGLIFVAAATPLTDKQFILLDYIKPEHYNIKLVPYNQDTFYGECDVNINILQPTHIINLYSDIRCILNIELTDNPPRFQQYGEEKVIYKPIKYLRDSKTQIAEFSFKNELSSGRYILNMKFIGVIADNGGFRRFSLVENKFIGVIAGNEETFTLTQNKNNNGGWMAATHYQIDSARRLFPCWDEPELKATFDISIIYPRNYKWLTMAFSNMQTRKIKILENNMMSIHYDTTLAMSTSVVGAVIINRAELFILNILGTATNRWLHMWNRKIISYLLFYTQDIVEKLTMYLKSEWKRSQKISKIDHVVIPDFYDENMMNLGLVLYR